MSQLGDYRELFITEAHEYLGSLNQATLSLEKNREDLEAIHTLFRAAHTLKGMAATMGFDGITKVAHEFESALDQIRSGAQPANPQLIDLLFEGIDELSRLVGEVAAGGEGGQADPALLERIKLAAKGELKAPSTSSGQAQGPSPAAPPAGDFPGFPPNPAMRSHVASRLAAGATVTHLKVSIDPKCAFKGVRAFLVVKSLAASGVVLHTLPEAKELEEGKFDPGFEAWVESGLSEDDLRHICTKVMEVASAEAARLKPLPPSAVPALPPASAHVPAQMPSAVGAPEAAPEKKAALPAESARPSTIRVSVERLDRIMNMVGELVTSKIRLGQIAREKQVKELSDVIVPFEHIVNELQAEAMAARMVPMEQVYNRFPRMVRDLAKELGKEVELVMEGSDIELDRTILDEITDPLIHLLRNSVDHGLEGPAERRQLGKNPTGTLRLSARREKNMVLISVEDDGSGIRTDKVRAAAVRRGLLREEQARALTEEEAINLISLPGFSTATEVTSISGRGVGVDAVRNKVEALGGSLRIESRPGLGSQFKVRLPLTLAIIQALLVKVGGEQYAAPVANVVEALEVSPSDLRMIHGQEVVMLREEVLPVFRLGRMLELEAPPALPPLFSVLVVEAGERRAGVLVEEVVGQTEIAIKSLGRFLKGIRGFGGVTVLGDGRICLILDFLSLLEL